MRSLKIDKNNKIFIFVACFAFYMLVRVVFEILVSAEKVVQIRPASAVGPVLGFYFGLPGIFACSTANFVCDFMFEGAAIETLITFFLTQVLFDGMPRWVWYLVFRNSNNPYLRFDTGNKIGFYMLLAIIDGIGVVLLNLQVVDYTRYTKPIAALIVHSLNNVWMLIYVGMPLLYFFERSSFKTIPPFWIRQPYEQNTKANLTQRFVIAFTLGAAIFLFIVSAVILASKMDEDTLPYAVALFYAITAFFAIPIFIPVFIALSVLEKHLVRPIEVLANDQNTFIERVGKSVDAGNLDFPISVDACGTKPVKEVADLFESTNKMRHDLAIFAKELYDMTTRKQRDAAELDIANRIQMSVVPSNFDALKNTHYLDIAGIMRPAREVGGDFYDVFDIDEHKVAFTIGDVSGKGVPAALFMMRTQNLLRQCILQASDLGSAFTQANKQLCTDNDAMLFVTAFGCILDTEKAELTYVNAGHNVPVTLQNDEVRETCVKHGIVLGAFEEAKYESVRTSFTKGDAMLLYTDGVTEATNEDDELFGDVRLLDCLKAEKDSVLNMQEIIDELTKSIDAFAGNTPQADDITALGFYWKAQSQEITLKPDVKELDHLTAFIEESCETFQCNLKTKNQLLLVSEEAFVNICKYAFMDDIERLPVKIEISIDEKSDRLYLVFTDFGLAFNPLKQETKKAEPEDEERHGGLGIFLMKNYLDDMTYTRDGEKNILRMTKSFNGDKK